MKTRTLVISAIAVTAVLTGGWALAQSVGPPSGFSTPFMHGEGPGGTGHGKMMGMGHGIGHGPGLMRGMGHGPGMMNGMGPGMMHGRPGAAFADPAQLETVKAELGITAAQETAWSKYAKAVEDASAAIRTARESVDPTAVSRMTPPERFAFVSRMREQGQKQFEAIRTAANDLLAVLDDTQKAKADDILPRLAFGPGPMRTPFAADPTHKD